MLALVVFGVCRANVFSFSLVGIGGIVVADRALNTDYGDQLRRRFVKSLEEEFTEPDGSILPIRSQLTGFTVLGPFCLHNAPAKDFTDSWSLRRPDRLRKQLVLRCIPSTYCAVGAPAFLS